MRPERNVTSPQVSPEDLVYIADMLRAVVWVKNDLGSISRETLVELEHSLGLAAASLRRLSAEMTEQKPSIVPGS